MRTTIDVFARLGAARVLRETAKRVNAPYAIVRSLPPESHTQAIKLGIAHVRPLVV